MWKFPWSVRNEYHSGHLKWQRDGYNSSHQKWQRTCRTPKHLVDLYESSKRNNGKRIETNFANYNPVNEPVNKASNEIDTGANLYYD